MPEHIKYEDDDLFNPETKHEESDVPVSALLKFIVIFIVFSVASYFIVLLLYKALVKSERNRMDPPETAVARPADASVPKNQPLLQPFPREAAKGELESPHVATPVVDLIEMRANEDRVLKHYGWVDQQHGVVHIPIAQAKEILASRIAVSGATGFSPSTTDTGGLKPAAPQPTVPDTGVAQPATTTTAGGTHP